MIIDNIIYFIGLTITLTSAIAGFLWIYWKLLDYCFRSAAYTTQIVMWYLHRKQFKEWCDNKFPNDAIPQPQNEIKENQTNL